MLWTSYASSLVWLSYRHCGCQRPSLLSCRRLTGTGLSAASWDYYQYECYQTLPVTKTQIERKTHWEARKSKRQWRTVVLFRAGGWCWQHGWWWWWWWWTTMTTATATTWQNRGGLYGEHEVAAAAVAAALALVLMVAKGSSIRCCSTQQSCRFVPRSLTTILIWTHFRTRAASAATYMHVHMFALSTLRCASALWSESEELREDVRRFPDSLKSSGEWECCHCRW